MGKRRSKKDKIIANLRREIRTATVSETGRQAPDATWEKTDVEVAEKQRQKTADKSPNYEYAELFYCSPELIKQDLLKTAILSIIFFTVEIGIFLIIS